MSEDIDIKFPEDYRRYSVRKWLESDESDYEMIEFFLLGSASILDSKPHLDIPEWATFEAIQKFAIMDAAPHEQMQQKCLDFADLFTDLGIQMEVLETSYDIDDEPPAI